MFQFISIYILIVKHRILMNKNNQYLALRNKWEQYEQAKVTNSLIVHSKKPSNTSSQVNLHSGVYQNFKD